MGPHMTKVLLINQEKLPHYRVPVYNYMSDYLKRERYALTVASEGIQEGSSYPVEFDNRMFPLTFLSLAKFLLTERPDVVIFWVRLRYLYLFPIIFLSKILGMKTIYWGHGSDLSRQDRVKLKRFLNNLEYFVFDAMVLYAEHLKASVETRFHPKIFIANNTLHCTYLQKAGFDKASLLAKYNITTRKNIVCCGRMQRRKRLEHLFTAFDLLQEQNVGLILVGPDTEGVLRGVSGKNIHILGPIYGDERLDLLSACDVFCLPGAVGLSIVDAFYCGLPIVTEEGDESPEIMYLKNGVNGFEVARGDTKELAAKLDLLLHDDALRGEFAAAAKTEIMTNGHMDKMCQGFVEALRFTEMDGRAANSQENKGFRDLPKASK
jgi:glycosyltransferase involved in cell wall biosynthesis